MPTDGPGRSSPSASCWRWVFSSPRPCPPHHPRGRPCVLTRSPLPYDGQSRASHLARSGREPGRARPPLRCQPDPAARGPAHAGRRGSDHHEARARCGRTELDAGEVQELYGLRLQLEPPLAKDIVDHVRRRDVDDLTSIVGQMKALGEHDSEEWSSLNYRFHRRVYELSERRHAVRLVVQVLNMVEPYARVHAHVLGSRPDTQQQQDAVVEAIRNGDSEQPRAPHRRRHPQRARGADVLDGTRAAAGPGRRSRRGDAGRDTSGCWIQSPKPCAGPFERCIQWINFFHPAARGDPRASSTTHRTSHIVGPVRPGAGRLRLQGRGDGRAPATPAR